MANEVYTDNGKDWKYICKGCWKTEPKDKTSNPFETEREASVALGLHKIGCKKN